MRKILALLLLVVVVLGGRAEAQTGAVLDEAAEAVRQDPVFVHPDAERPLSDAEADRVRERVRSSGAPMFVAVLPASAIDEAGADASEVPRALADRTGLEGTYAVVAGPSFRAGSSVLAAGEAGALATRAFQAHSDRGVAAVLVAFVDEVAAATAGGGGTAGGGAPAETDGDGGGSSLAPLLLVGGAGAVGVWALSRRRRQREAAVEAAAETAADRQILQAELSVLADDVLALERQVDIHPEARQDYDAAVARYRAAAAAMDYADDEVDLMRVRRVVSEAQYAMARARARVEGREPPPPPAELRVPGPHDEPPLDVDDDRRPVYVGYGQPFYGGGWFGGTGSFFGGLLLGQMLGGGWGWGSGGGDASGEAGAGDLGGGDFGGDLGGDFDVGGGGGDW